MSGENRFECRAWHLEESQVYPSMHRPCLPLSFCFGLPFTAKQAPPSGPFSMPLLGQLGLSIGEGVLG